MARKATSPERILQRLIADLASLRPEDRERCQRMILCEVVEALHGGGVIATATVVTRQQNALEEQLAKNSRRSRREDKERNDKIRSDRAKGLSLGMIAMRHRLTIESVRGVLYREKKRCRPA